VPRKSWVSGFDVSLGLDMARTDKNPEHSHLQVTEISGLCAFGSFWEMALAVDLKVRRWRFGIFLVRP